MDKKYCNLGFSNTCTELSAGQFQSNYNDVINRITRLVSQGVDTNERIGGIRALIAMIDFKGDDAGQKTTKFSTVLNTVLAGNDPAAMFLASEAIGRLATPGGTLTAELVESEIHSMLEYLQDSQRVENHRLAAVLVIKELAKNSATLMYQYVPVVLETIWVALRDPKYLIRETASEAVGACLEISTPRAGTQQTQVFQRLYEKVIEGFSMNTTEAIHGSLLTIKQLVLKAGMFMEGNRYREACDITFRFKEAKDPVIRREVLNIIPTLATYAPDKFTNNYLHMCMHWLQNLITRKVRENIAAFVTIGNIALAVKSKIVPYVDGILQLIRDALIAKT